MSHHVGFGPLYQRGTLRVHSGRYTLYSPSSSSHVVCVPVIVNEKEILNML